MYVSLTVIYLHAVGGITFRFVYMILRLLPIVSLSQHKLLYNRMEKAFTFLDLIDQLNHLEKTMDMSMSLNILSSLFTERI